MATLRTFSTRGLEGAVEGGVAAVDWPDGFGRFMEPSAFCSRVMTGFSRSTSDTSMVPPKMAVRLYRTRTRSMVASEAAPLGVTWSLVSSNPEKGWRDKSSTATVAPIASETLGSTKLFKNIELVRKKYRTTNEATAPPAMSGQRRAGRTVSEDMFKFGGGSCLRFCLGWR